MSLADAEHDVAEEVFALSPRMAEKEKNARMSLRGQRAALTSKAERKKNKRDAEELLNISKPDTVRSARRQFYTLRTDLESSEGHSRTLRGETHFLRKLLLRPAAPPPPPPPAAEEAHEEAEKEPERPKNMRASGGGSQRSRTLKVRIKKTARESAESLHRSTGDLEAAKNDTLWSIAAHKALSKLHAGVNLFEEPDTAENVRLAPEEDDDEPLHAASVCKLIAALTLSGGSSDVTSALAFLYAFPVLFDVSTLFALLEARWSMDAPAGVDDVDAWKEQVLFQVRLKVFAFVRLFLKRRRALAYTDAVKRILLEFVDKVMTETPGFEAMGKQLHAQIINVSMGGDAAATIELKTAPSIIPPWKKTLALNTIHPTEIARQMTLLDYENYSRIECDELLNKRWQSSDSVRLAPNVLHMIDHTNHMVHFFVTEILRETEVTARAHLILRLIAVGRQCQALQNYQGVCQVVGALKHGAVNRLKKSWAHVEKRGLDAFELLSDLMAQRDNFSLLRRRMEMRLPCVPFLGLYLSDLCFLQDGNPDFYPQSDLLFVLKFSRIGQVISRALRARDSPYCLEVSPKIRNWLLNTETWERSVLFSRSKVLEPRAPKKK